MARQITNVIYRIEIFLTDKFEGGSTTYVTMWESTEEERDNIRNAITARYQREYHIDNILITGIILPECGILYTDIEEPL